MWPTPHPDLPLRTWSLVVTIGVVLCWLLLIRRTDRLGYPRRRILFWLVSAFPVGALTAALGAGLVRVALGRTDSIAPGDASTGMTVLGAIVGVLGWSLLYARFVLRTSPLRLLDAAAFTFPVAVAFGRVGCLLNGCCFGIPTDTLGAPLGVPLGAYAPGTLAATTHAHLPAATHLVNLPLLLIAGALVTLLVAESLFRRRDALRLPPGFVVLAALATDGALRFAAEFSRAEPGDAANPWQIWTLVLTLAAAAGLAILWRRRPAPPLLEGSP
jgi:prolipoprotein diacylglyceryltransferase